MELRWKTKAGIGIFWPRHAAFDGNLEMGGNGQTHVLAFTPCSLILPGTECTNKLFGKFVALDLNWSEV